MLRIYFAFFSFFLMFSFGEGVYANIFDGVDTAPLSETSMTIGTNSNNLIDASKDLGFRILTAVRLLVSGFALIYLVLIGAYMITFSENEERVKAQKTQITYALIAFLFLNIPGMLYSAFFESGKPADRTIGDAVRFDFLDLDVLSGQSGAVGMLIGFFEVFIFGLAILTLTWGFFKMIVAGGDDEKVKNAKNKIIYGVLGLIFLGFVRVWGAVIARGNLLTEGADLANKILGVALYFAAPVVTFFFVLASYYYITSGGDEERVKKAKTIFTNTLFAALILLGAYSFLNDLVAFSL